jgi:hypothetical protein
VTSDQRCTCVPYPYGDGPERDCPVHGEHDGTVVIDPDPCPDCGLDPDDDTLHAVGCRRILPAGDPLEPLQFGPPWQPWPDRVGSDAP